MAFITREGHIISTAEPEGWIEKSRTLSGKDDEQAFALLRKALGWYQTHAAGAGEEGVAACLFGEAMALLHIATLHADRKEWKESSRFFADARSFFARVAAMEAEGNLLTDYGSATNETIALRNLSISCGRMKEYRRALEAADASRDLCRELGDIAGESQSLQFGAYALASLNRHAEAIQRLETAVRLAREAGDEPFEIGRAHV